MNIENAVKENTNTSVECQAHSANPASSIGIDFLIGTTKQSHIIPQVTSTPGSDNGIVKNFVFTFKTDRSQHGTAARCHLLWDGHTTDEKKEYYLNITCK